MQIILFELMERTMSSDSACLPDVTIEFNYCCMSWLIMFLVWIFTQLALGCGSDLTDSDSTSVYGQLLHHLEVDRAIYPNPIKLHWHTDLTRLMF